MAKLFFHYASMNAGKSTLLLQTIHNYKELNAEVLVLSTTSDKVESRLGLSEEAIKIDQDIDIMDIVSSIDPKIKCIFIDEAQFLTKQQVYDLSYIVDEYNVPVMTYGLRTDYRGQPFEGSIYLLALADKLVELKTLCHCGRKATMNKRLDYSKEIVELDKNKYVPVCRKHFNCA